MTSQSLNEIESNLLDTLKRINCPPIKNICNIEPHIKLENILLDQSYVDDKLNLFVWAILKYQPRFAAEFIDSEYLPIDNKCKKIVEALHLIGFIDSTVLDYNDRLLNTNKRHFKEILSILKNMVAVIESNRNFKEILADETFNLDLTIANTPINNIHMLNNQFNPTFDRPNLNDEKENELNRKLQMLDDANFAVDYRALLQYGSSSLITPDISRIVKSLNDGSDYLLSSELQSGKLKADEMVRLVESKLSNLAELNANETTKTNLNETTSTMNQIELIQVNKLESFKNLEKEMANSDANLSKINEFFEANLQKLEHLNKNMNNAALQSSDGSILGKYLFDFKSQSQKLDQLCRTFTGWHSFIEKQINKQNEYERYLMLCNNSSSSNSTISPEGAVDSAAVESSFNKQLIDYLTLMGESNALRNSKFNRSHHQQHDVDALLFS